MCPRFRIKYLLLFAIICVILRVFGVFTHIFEHDYFTNFEYPYNGDIHTSVLQLRYNQKPDIQPINLYKYDYIKDCHHKCMNNGNVVPTRLIYIVKSAPEHFDLRIAIRNTWGYERRFSDVQIRTVFVLGTRIDSELQQQIDKESVQYRDIVQVNFVDTYYNNTIKTMMGMKWAVTFCNESKFYMFVDDDYYVSTKNVLLFVRNPVNYPEYIRKLKGKLLKEAMEYELPHDVKLYAGFVFFTAPHRHLTSKWYVSIKEYPFHMWPPYVTAGAYILSQEALLDLYYTSFYTEHFKFDDVYVGLLAKKAGIEPFHVEEFHFYKKPYDAADYRFTVASHGYASPSELMQVWTEQKSLGNA